MQISVYRDPSEFVERAGSFLLRAEVENNLMLGIGAGAPWRGGEAYLAVVEEAGEVVACAARTPPYKAIVSRGTAAAIQCLGRDLARAYPDLPRVFGPEAAVAQIAADWEERTGVPSVQGMRQQLFEAREVGDVPQVRGRLRLATARDVALLLSWGAAFIAEASPSDCIDVGAHVRNGIAARSLYVWDAGEPVSMASWAGRTSRGVCVSFVYTPPRFRRRGYATACVAQLTRQLLAGGQTFCCLFADLSNATSNNIYRAIGYRPVSVFSDYILNTRKPASDVS